MRTRVGISSELADRVAAIQGSRVRGWLVRIAGAMLLVELPLLAAGETVREHDPAGLAAYRVSWDSPSQNSQGSMPLGNGDIGVNAWVEPGGELVLLLSKSDAWSGNCRLLKLGRVRVRPVPGPDLERDGFEQQLRLDEGEMRVRWGPAGNGTELRVWVDALAPVVRVEASSHVARAWEVEFETWRTEERVIEGSEAHSAYGLEGGPEPIISHPDTILAEQSDRLVWYHRNERSIWEDNLRHQGLEAQLAASRDPLQHRTFGGWIEGDGLRLDGKRVLRSEQAATRLELGIHLLTAQTATAEAWRDALEAQVAGTRAVDWEQARSAHRDWWARFWRRSWIMARGRRATVQLPTRLPHALRAGQDQAGGHGFAGQIDRVSLWGRAVSSAEIDAWAAGGREPLQEQAGLLGSWAQPARGTTLLAAEEFQPSEAWTIEAWVRPERLAGTSARIVDAVTPGVGDGILLDTHPENSLRLVAGRHLLQVPDALPAGNWTHVAAVFDDSDTTLRLYVNGQLAQQATAGSETDAEEISRAYALQRYLQACAGRGAYPIKFNGSLFTVDMEGFDPDYRRWGGPYWWQNTRLSYWPMLASGDFEMMNPLFAMYQATLPLAEHRTQVWFGHRGAFFPETMYFWGMFTNSNYGWKRENLPVGEVTNRYIRREYTASLELLAMMRDYYDYTREERFLQERLLPLSDRLLTFWNEHYPRDEQGRLVMYPAQALETLQDAKNPTPDIAGLKWVLDRLLELPQDQVGPERVAFWHQLRRAVPPLPMTGEGNQQRVLGAEEVYGGRGNAENPELYVVFPFRHYGLGKPDLEIGRQTFEHRTARRGPRGWTQDDTQAALLGLTEQAVELVAGRVRNTHPGSRFPAFWGHFANWTPCQDHGGNLLKTLQTMLLQADGDRILLFPAWPPDWDVSFKLHAPQQTTLEGTYRDGKLETLTVTPASRRADVQVLGGITAPE